MKYLDHSSNAQRSPRIILSYRTYSLITIRLEYYEILEYQRSNTGTGKPDNTYYVTDGGLSDSCEHSACSTDTCNAGYYRNLCGFESNTSHPGT